MEYENVIALKYTYQPIPCKMKPEGISTNYKSKGIQQIATLMGPELPRVTPFPAVSLTKVA